MAPDAGTVALLALAFAVVAAVYASVGFGGGSSYLALLTLAGVPLAAVGPVALLCNIVVVAGGAWQFARAGHVRAALLVPFLVTSLPAAYLGGRVRLDVPHLAAWTGVALLLAAGAMLVRNHGTDADGNPVVPPAPRLWTAGPVVGTALGGLSGFIGIGGGVFLAPVLHLRRWGTARQIAATSSLFILANSLSDLAGQLEQAPATTLGPYVPLVAAVLVGGQIGSRLGAWRLAPGRVRQLTALVVGLAAVNLLLRG